jgi:hypothetical protein
MPQPAAPRQEGGQEPEEVAVTAVDLERVAEILVDAYAIGDGPAARKWMTSKRTIQRYRARVKTDADLAALVLQKRGETEEELSVLRVQFLRRALVVLERKIKKRSATVHEVAGAVKIVGELHQVAEVLDAGDDEPDPDAQGAPEGDSANGPH